MQSDGPASNDIDWGQFTTDAAIRLISHLSAQLFNYERASPDLESYYNSKSHWILPALKVATSNNDIRCVLFADKLFLILERLGRIELSEELMRVAIGSIDRENNTELEGTFLNHLGRVQFIRGSLTESRKTYQLLTAKMRHQENVVGSAKALIGLAIAMEALGRHEAALRLHNAALRRATSVLDGIERRRLLIINALFMAAARLGCRPSMSTSKYGQDAGSERDISITIGETHTYFTIELVKSKKKDQRERLRLALGTARGRTSAGKSWEDNDKDSLESQLTVILVDMLVGAETCYRNGLIRHREWIIERKAAAEAELKRRQEEAEREARELQEKLARERIGRLLTQAKALDRANQIRTYVGAASLRITELPVEKADFDRWAEWARREADRIDPVKNGTITEAVNEPPDGE